MALLALALVLLADCGGAVKLYPHQLDPRDNPQYDRYAVPHPSLGVFDKVPEFATLRYPNLTSNTTFTESIELYCLDQRTTLGRVIWPGSGDILGKEEFGSFVDYVGSKGLYISAIHTFPPFASFVAPSREALGHLESVLGERWFGMSNGEEDGHYTSYFVDEELPLNADHRSQYLNFREYFDKMETIFGPRMTTLLTCTYPHYQLKSGLYTVAGAETSQHGSNSQLRYAFIRGAGKQYGVIWFGNVSVYNRFGHKVYERPNTGTSATRAQVKHKNKFGSSSARNYTCSESVPGPECGTSLNALKRLLYSHIMYSSGYVSIENGWFYKDDQFSTMLTPIGLLQHNAYLWSQRLPSFGTHVPTVAIYLDFFNGWAAPRQTKSYEFYTWHSLLYEEGDYFSDGLFRMIYPSYQDASYFHDETGVSSATPYGDCLDVLLSDAPSWVLQQYDTVIVSSSLSAGLEVEYNLFEYFNDGGNLVITAANLAGLPNGSLGVTTKLDCKSVKAGSKVYLWDGRVVVESNDMEVCDLHCQTQDCTSLAQLDDSTPLVIWRQTPKGGSLTVFASPFAISSQLVTKPASQVDETLSSPYPLLDHARVILHSLLSNASLFSSQANLSLVPTFLGEDQFLVLVTNPELRQQPLKLTSAQGTLASLEEIGLDQSEKGAEGYLPDGFQGTDIGKSTNSTIAGGDTRLFAVKLSSQSLKLLPKVSPKPRPNGIALHLRKVEHSIRYEVLLRPSFFQHYDSVVVDYSYMETWDLEFLRAENHWLVRQNISVYVDASPAINVFPDLRLTKDDATFYNETIKKLTELMFKVNALGSHNLILSLHPYPIKWPKDMSLPDFNATLHYLNKLASELNISLAMLDTPKNPLPVKALDNWLNDNHLSFITLVMNTARLVTYGYKPEYDNLIASRSSLLYVDAPAFDAFGKYFADNLPLAQANVTVRGLVDNMLRHVCSLRQCPYSSHSPIPDPPRPRASDGEYDFPSPARVLGSNGSPLPIVMDAVYSDQDSEFADIHIIESLLLGQ